MWVPLQMCLLRGEGAALAALRAGPNTTPQVMPPIHPAVEQVSNHVYSYPMHSASLL